MALSPLAGKPAPPELLIDLARLERDYLERRPDRTIPPSWSASAPAATAARRCAARSPRPTSWPSPRPSASTAARTGSTARSTWARTRTRCPARRSGRRWRCWRPTASRPSSSATTASRRRRSISHAILVYNRGRNDAPGRRHRHHAVAQPAGGRRLQVQPAQRRPGRHRRHRLDPGPRQRAAARRQHRA